MVFDSGAGDALPHGSLVLDMNSHPPPDARAYAGRLGASASTACMAPPADRPEVLESQCFPDPTDEIQPARGSM